MSNPPVEQVSLQSFCSVMGSLLHMCPTSSGSCRKTRADDTFGLLRIEQDFFLVWAEAVMGQKGTTHPMLTASLATGVQERAFSMAIFNLRSGARCPQVCVKACLLPRKIFVKAPFNHNLLSLIRSALLSRLRVVFVCGLATAASRTQVLRLSPLRLWKTSRYKGHRPLSTRRTFSINRPKS